MTEAHSGWKKLIRQVDRRTSSERRDYMRSYHARRRHDNGMDGDLPRVAVPQMPRCPPANSVSSGFFLRDDAVRRHLRDGTGMLMWPERRETHPESLSETAKRCRRG